MSERASGIRRYVIAAVALTAGVAMATHTMAQSSADKWWTGFGNGPDNSRYFASKQITKANVNQLQVAWTYPYGDSGSNPIVVRGVAYGRGRNGSLVAVDATAAPTDRAELVEVGEHARAVDRDRGHRGGNSRRQCSAISRPVANQTPSCASAWSRNRARPCARPGRPTVRSCSPTGMSRGLRAPSA